MAYDEMLGKRIANIFTSHKIKFIEKKMFGGLTFMVKDKMCIGVMKNDIMVRCAPEDHDTYLKKPFARPMEFGGKTMKGFLNVAPDGIKTDTELKKWMDVGLDFVENAPDKPKKKNRNTDETDQTDKHR